jgi:hypothetical protein
VKLDVISEFDRDGNLVAPWHPIDLEATLAPVREEALMRVATMLATAKPSARQPLIAEWPDRNLRVTVELTSIHASTGDEPDRVIAHSMSFGRYDPVGMLARLIRPIDAKARKRQAGVRGGLIRALVCDISQTIVGPHLADESRQDDYARVLRDLEPRLHSDYDLIALCAPQGWARPLLLHLAICDGDSRPILEELFGSPEAALAT